MSLISYHVWSGAQSESVSDPESENTEKKLQADEEKIIWLLSNSRGIYLKHFLETVVLGHCY